VPRIAVERDVMGVVVPSEGEGETLDGDPIEFTRITVRLLDLPDQAGVHRSDLLPADGGLISDGAEWRRRPGKAEGTPAGKPSRNEAARA
jgi:hypothetical protein